MSIDEPPVTLLRRPMLCVWLAVAAYLLAFACSFPTVLTVSDEASYVRQAAMFARGQVKLSENDAATGEARETVPSDYPPGTSLLMAPLIAFGGWRAAFLLGAACCAGATLLLASLLARHRRSPLFALLFLAYPPVLIISRCGMSDLPTTLLVVAGLYCFFRGDGIGWRLAAGFLAGVTLLFRETAPLLFIFFFAGALVRRERYVWALVVGGLGGVALRPLASMLVFGDALFLKPGHPGFALSALAGNAGLYALALLVFVPGGLVLAALYRGARRVEFLLTLGVFTLLHLLYDYNAAASGGFKQFVLGPRFFIPMLPVLILAMAESVPRLWEGLLARMDVAGRVAASRAARFLSVGLVLAVAAEAGIASYIHEQWQNNQRAIVGAIYAGTEQRSPLVTNLDATRKFVNELYDQEFGQRTVESFADLDDKRLRALLSRHGRITVALLRRTDSAAWKEKAEQERARLAALTKSLRVQTSGVSFPTGESLEISVIEPGP